MIKRTAMALMWALPLGLALSPFAQAQTAPTRQSSVIPDRYLVVFKDNVGNPDQAADAAMQGSGGQIHFKYKNAIKGFAATIPAKALNGLRNNPNVASIEYDKTVFSDQALTTQSNATWGLDRVNQRSLPLDATYSYASTGAGVTAYVIDTGILASHQEFTGRVGSGYTAIADGNGTTDCNGHGTHVSGTVGGTTYGVAKGVTLVPVRVLDCTGSGSSSGVIAGIDWMVGVAPAGSVANMSLGGGFSSTLNSAVANAVSKGITMVVAAGNSSADACSSSPSSEPSAITVGATTSTDAMASYSNYGTCVDLFAPGSSITSSWYTSTSATAVLSGTSMATPHVTGIAALVAAANPGFTPAQVTSSITQNATSGKVTGLGTGSSNLLAYSLPTNIAAPTYTVAVKSIAGSSGKTGNGWSAKATTTIYDTNTSSSNLPNATISGRFGNGSTGSCLTGSTGSCVISGPKLSNSTPSITFTVTGVSGSGYTYNATANAVSQITIAKP